MREVWLGPVGGSEEAALHEVRPDGIGERADYPVRLMTPVHLCVPEDLQAKCRRQAMAIDTLGEALSTFERGARALKADNSALRAENDRLRRRRSVASRPDG